MYEIDAPRFFRMVFRMPAYKGVMRMRAEAEAEKARPKSRDELKERQKAGTLSPEEQKALEYSTALGRGSAKR